MCKAYVWYICSISPVVSVITIVYLWYILSIPCLLQVDMLYVCNISQNIPGWSRDIPIPTSFLTAGTWNIPEIPRGWCQTSGAGPASSDPPAMASERVASTLSSQKLRAAALQAGECRMIWILAAVTDGYDLWNIPLLSKPLHKTGSGVVHLTVPTLDSTKQ